MRYENCHNTICDATQKQRRTSQTMQSSAGEGEANKHSVKHTCTGDCHGSAALQNYSFLFHQHHIVSNK